MYTTGKLTKNDIPFIIGLVLIGLFLFLIYIWAMPLIDPDEPRYASTARDMIVNGNWIVPYFNGIPRINKPPLFYWTIAISYKVFGINEFSARLPSALAAIGTAIITYLWGKRLGNRKNGFWAAMLLITSPLFFLISRLCITDMLLTFFICVSLYLFYIEYTETMKRNHRKLLLYFSLSMVFIVKGPVGILLFSLVTICFLSWKRDFQYIKRLWYLPGFLLFLGIICAWGIPFWFSLGTKQILTLVSQETVEKYISGYSHQQPFYYYLPVYLMGFFPWSLFVFATLFIYTFNKKKILSARERSHINFLFFWLVLVLIFFSVCHSKLMTYILPMSPSIALLNSLLFKWENEGKYRKEIAYTSWVVIFVYTTIPIVLILTIQKWIPKNYGVSISHIIIPIVVLFIGTLIALFVFSTRGHFSQLQKILCFTNCMFLIITVVYLAKYIGTFRSTKGIVEMCLSEKTNYTLLNYSKIDPSLIFYSGKNVKNVDCDSPVEEFQPKSNESIYLVMSLHDYKKQKKWIQEREFHVVCQNNTHVVVTK